MTLTIPYEFSGISLDPNFKGDLKLTFSNSTELTTNLFNQMLYEMSYDDIINAITPQSFEQIMEHYKTNYKDTE